MKTEHYFVRLQGTRDGWPEGMTDREEQVMREHYAYLKDLTYRKKVLSAGPVLGGDVFGLVILRVHSEAEAMAIMAAEPSVIAGVHRYEMQPMVLSLAADHRSPLRYVQSPGERVLRKEVTVPAGIDKVWRLWTTPEGIEAFLGVKARVELRIGGPFELLFDPTAEPGMQGSEDCKILSYLPGRMLSFEWNAPPQFPSRRAYERTWVVLELEPRDDGQTRVILTQLGWGEGDDWDQVYQYFDRAWESVLQVMANYLAENRK